MTNTLHRQDKVEDLKQDYVIFATTARGITREGAAPKLQEFTRICLKHNPVNIGESKQGNILQEDTDIQQLIASQKDTSGAGAVFTDLDTLRGVIEELIEADLGETIRIAIANDTAWPHAMHLHGHHFHQITADGQQGPLRDTLLMDRGETAEIAFVADNPGDWLLHCHMLEHSAAGMMTWLRIA